MEQITMTDAEIAQAQQYLYQLNQLIPQLDALKACGVDCSARLAKIQSISNGLNELLRQFGGNQ